LTEEGRRRERAAGSCEAIRMSDIRSPTVTIADGVAMPLLGLGTWQASDREAYDAVRTALDLGYRLIDTATMYRNEVAVGRAVRDSGLAREEVFVTTKLRAGDAGREQETIRASLDAMGLDYLDLWLIHWPVARGMGVGTWQRFIEARDAGLTRAIGVSNYSAAEIDELTDATGVVPAVNQIEWTPALYDATTVAAHRDRGVTLEGYSPFKAADLRDPVLLAIAKDHGVTVPQVILRWHLEHGFVAIPKSADARRIAENFDVFGFSLDGNEVARIDSLAG
jgi:2,5-diketo-D-gluconate reductase A